jgi:hypothetical protein
MDYYQKYQKYKFKYYNLLNQFGAGCDTYTDTNSGYSVLVVNEIKDAVKNGKKLKEINEKYMNRLTPEQYFDICKIAVTSNLSDFEDVLHMEMKAEQYLEICYEILEIAKYFQVPYKRYLKICIKAVENNGLALKYINKDYFVNNYNDYINLCNLAKVKTDYKITVLLDNTI